MGRLRPVRFQGAVDAPGTLRSGAGIKSGHALELRLWVSRVVPDVFEDYGDAGGVGLNV